MELQYLFNGPRVVFRFSWENILKLNTHGTILKQLKAKWCNANYKKCSRNLDIKMNVGRPTWGDYRIEPVLEGCACNILRGQ